MLTHGVVAAVRVLRNHSESTTIVFLLYLQQFVSTPLPILCVSKVATELRMHNCTVLRTVTIFVLTFLLLLIYRRQRKSPNSFALKCSFHWNRFAPPIKVFEKIDLKVRVRNRPNLKFYPDVALLC